MSNCHIGLLIWSCKAAIVIKHQRRWARKGEDYTVWAIHGTIHPFIALGFPHSRSRKYSIVGHVRAGCGLEEDGRSAEVTTLISDASLHCIVHCASIWQPHCEDALWSKNATKADYFVRGKGQVPACRCFSVSGGFLRVWISHFFKWLLLIMNNTLLHEGSFVCGEAKSVACMPLVLSVIADCFSFLRANPVKPLVWIIMLPFSALPWFH